MRAIAVAPSQENAVKSRLKAAQPQTHTNAPTHASNIPGSIPFIQRKSLCPCDGGCPRCTNGGVIQPKLTIGQPNDQYEQEADRVADLVMRMPEPRVQREVACTTCDDLDEEEQIQTKPIGDQITPLVQRQVDEEEEEEEPVQAKQDNSQTPGAISNIKSSVNSLKGGGQPLPEGARAFFEPRFGQDFSRVRVHTNSKAVKAAKSINAKAFTIKKDIVFGAGQYAPGTDVGKRLLAHELTHIVQQGDRLQNGPVVQRRVIDNYVDCRKPTPATAAITGKNPVGVIRAADTRAIEMADEILAELKYIRRRIIAGEQPSWPLISDAIAVPLKTRFRLNPDKRRTWTRTGRGTVHLLIRRLQSIRNILNSGRIRYICIGPKRISYRNCSGPCCYGGDSCACENILRIWLCRPFWKQLNDRKAISLLHEAFHVYYGWPNHPGRLTNACCLDMFMGYYFGVPTPTKSGCPIVCH